MIDSIQCIQCRVEVFHGNAVLEGSFVKIKPLDCHSMMRSQDSCSCVLAGKCQSVLESSCTNPLRDAPLGTTWQLSYSLGGRRW